MWLSEVNVAAGLGGGDGILYPFIYLGIFHPLTL